MKTFGSFIKVWHPVYAEESGNSDANANANANGAGGQNPPPAPKTFTQEQLDKIVQDRVKKLQDSNKNAITELETLRSKAQLTQQERDELEGRIENMKNEHLTKDELAAKERQKLEKQYKEETEKLTKQAATWQARFTESTILRSITDASVTNDAFDPEQVAAILRPNTSLLEVLEDGKPTGNFAAKVKFADVDKDGKPVTLELEVPQAVKRMKELDRFKNLFKDTSSGGLGARNTGGGNPLDITKLTPEQYRKARKEGKINL